MIIHKGLKEFLEIIFISNLDFKPISEHDLRKQFKNNQYYNIKLFCKENNLITIEYHKINLTNDGINLFKILKKLQKF